MPRILVPVLLILLLVAATASGQSATPETARIAELEAEVKLLRARLSLLENDSDAPADPKSLLAPAKPKSTSRDAGPRLRSAKSAVDLLERLSDEAAADRTGTWNATTEALATEELAYGVWNTPYGAKITVKNVNVQSNPAATTDPLASPYVITIHFESNTHKFRDQTVVEAFDPVKVFADAALRGRVEKLREGRKVAVRGRIKTVKAGAYGYGQGLKPRAQLQGPPSFLVTVKFRELEIAGVM